MWKIQLFRLNYDARETEAVSRIVNEGWLSMGDETAKFESSFAKFLGNEVSCSAVSNCTAALHMSLLAADVGPGDEVIIPSLTFVANLNVVNFVGAEAKLADCKSLNNWNVSLDSIKKKVTDKTKAIILVHFAGYPCEDILEISNFCKENNIFLIEDAAHAPGASFKGRKCGTFGDIGCFSFFSNKNLSVGEGGMTSSSNPILASKLRNLRSHGMTTLSFDRHNGRATTYDVTQSGLNYRLDEIRSALGLVQLKKLKDGNKKREKLTNRYRSNFNNSDICMPFHNLSPHSKSAYHILPILLPHGCDKPKVIENLKTKGIQTSIHYPAFWDFSAFRNYFEKNDTPVTFDICSRELTLPLYPTMTIDEVDEVSSSILEAIS